MSGLNFALSLGHWSLLLQLFTVCFVNFSTTHIGSNVKWLEDGSLANSSAEKVEVLISNTVRAKFMIMMKNKPIAHTCTHVYASICTNIPTYTYHVTHMHTHTHCTHVRTHLSCPVWKKETTLSICNLSCASTGGLHSWTARPPALLNHLWLASHLTAPPSVYLRVYSSLMYVHLCLFRAPLLNTFTFFTCHSHW